MPREKRFRCTKCDNETFAKWNFCLSCGEKKPLVPIWDDNLARHHAHPFYNEVETYWNETRYGQIDKGAEKYDEPFNPDSWSDDELSDHAMQENVDQAVYITGLRDRLRKMRRHIRNLEDRIQELEEERSDL